MSRSREENRDRIRKSCKTYEGNWDWGYMALMTLLAIIVAFVSSFLIVMLAWAIWVAPYHWPIIPTALVSYGIYKFWRWIILEE